VNGLGQAELLEHGLEHWERVGFLVVESASQANKYRLAKSVIVSG
jgi:hypothetical protein